MLRKFPFPYRNMLAILSDVDSNDKEKFEDTHRFMNTLADCGEMGQGVGLDIGDTFFMGSVGKIYTANPPENEWYYWCCKNCMEIAARYIRKYIKAGWIDIPHTFFNYKDKNAFSRKQVMDIVKEWKRIGFEPIAWVDHADCPWNIMFFNENRLAVAAEAGDSTIIVDSGSSNAGNYIVFPSTGEEAMILQIDVSVKSNIVTLDRCLKNAYPKDEYFTEHPQMESAGANPNSGYYCADLARQAGIKAFWAPIPQNIRNKTLRGNLGFDTCIIAKKLPDNRDVWGLLRNYEYGQTNNTWLGKCINRALFGDRFSDSKPANTDTYIIISTHLGYADSDGLWDNERYTISDNIYEVNGGKCFNDETIQAFKNLKMKQDNGEILVTRTSRLVKYNLVHDMLTKYAHTPDGFTISMSSEGEKIIIHKVHDDCFEEFIPSLEDLRGITFYCKNPETAQVWINNIRIDSSEIQINHEDHTGSKSLGIKWHKHDTTDYTA